MLASMRFGCSIDRLLQPYRKRKTHGHGSTQPGLLLKAHIPLRTFHGWDETRPGFVEMDLVAHGGPSALGSCIYTLTLTDVATGWTECLPLLLKSAEAVLVAVEQARALFPFPILGLDVDNGGEFINVLLVAYCQAHRITLTRGRAALKADQCSVEQKNRVVVRAFVGYDRLVGAQAYWQLRELYRAVRLYVNCFQPSMKLLDKQQEGETIHRVYDPAKTPLQRLVLSGILSADRQQEVSQVAQALDPVRLLEQVEHLQQALWRCIEDTAPLKPDAEMAFVPFCVYHCLQSASSVSQNEVMVGIVRRQQSEPSGCTEMPDGSSPEREQVLTMMERPWPQEILQAVVPATVSARSEQQARLSSPRALSLALPAVLIPPEQKQAIARRGQRRSGATNAISSGAGCVPSAILALGERCFTEQGYFTMSDASFSQEKDRQVLPIADRAVTIEQAIQDYLQEQRANGRRTKTIEWHQTALHFFQQYLQGEQHLALLTEITAREVRGWLAFLQTTPSAKGTVRSAGTITTYARSVRAFCHWAERHGYLGQCPVNLKTEKKPCALMDAEMFDRLLHACDAAREHELAAQPMAVRNRAILWVLWDTGMRVSELWS